MQIEKTTKHRLPDPSSSQWHVIDAKGERLGRLASKVAQLLQGKHSSGYSPHLLTGDFVIVINASNIDVSGNKLTQKVYYRHTGYVGHLRQRTLGEMLSKFPERVIEKAVKGMLPRNKLANRMLRRLKVYSGDSHPHEAQLRAGSGSRAAVREAKELAASQLKIANASSGLELATRKPSSKSKSLTVKNDPEASRQDKTVKAKAKAADSKAKTTASKSLRAKPTPQKASTEQKATKARKPRTTPKGQE
ncbi:MAG: 50S ribosomal protein L13 [Dehalococcoidia bacterium]|nr:50S ribosomal protein L13 [Dehalococcoidia bacterium]